VDRKLVQVISRRSGGWRLPDASHLLDDTAVVVFVDFSDGPPQFYPVQADRFRQDVADRYATHPDRGTRQHKADNRHVVRTEHVAQWRDRWEDALRDAEPCSCMLS